MAVLAWFMWRRWQYRMWVKDAVMVGGSTILTSCHNNNFAGCRKHPVIYNDMCRIVRGMK
jgi:predicted nucleic acid binding AN1-type Zn finger protein